MKKLCLLTFIIVTTTMCSNKPKEPILVIQTNYGNIKVKLYNETPIHRDNFIQKAEEGFYKDLIFHRVIEDFMIQGGNFATRYHSDTTLMEDEKMRDTIPAEIKFPQLFHKRGALAAARWGDDVNPTWASDASQFYIVTGKLVSDEKLDEIETTRFEDLKKSIYNHIQSANMYTIKALYRDSNRVAITELRAQWVEQAETEAKERRPEVKFTEAQREYYRTKGGTPHLDGRYTVFGEVLEGMDVVDKIQKVKTNAKDRPLHNIVMNVVVLEK